MVDPFLPEREKVAAIREALPATGAGIYLNTGSVGPLSIETMKAVREIDDRELQVGRASPDEWDAFLERLEETRGVIGAVLGAGVGEVAITHGTTEAVDTAIWATDPQPGDRFVTTSLEYPGVMAMLGVLREHFRGELVVVDVGDASDETAVLDAFARAMAPGAKLVVVSHVSYANGAELPVEAICRLAADAGAWSIVDGAQSVGAIPVDVGAIGADFYAFAGQKWLLGPEGTGALWVGPRGLAEGRQTYVGAASFRAVAPDGSAEPWPDARRFEASVFHRPSIAGLARSVGWLAMYVGLGWAYERATRLARQAADSLAEVAGIEMLTPRERMATLVTFRIAGWPAEAARVELAKRIFAVVRTIPELDALRISVGFFTTEEELARFVETVDLLAHHSPETIPRRPTLVVLPEARA
jgi:L-cysteine/cystine lyase